MSPIEAIGDLAEALKVKNIKDLPGLWTVDIDDKWKLSANGHRKTFDNIPPFHFAIEFNGWPAGILDPLGNGMIAAGELANSDTFIQAVKDKIERITNASQTTQT